MPTTCIFVFKICVRYNPNVTRYLNTAILFKFNTQPTLLWSSPPSFVRMSF